MTNPSHSAAHKNKPTDYRRAKELRQNSTNGEQILWAQLRLATKNTDLRFRRQHPLHPYIADFACLKLRLIIEVDGISHNIRLEEDKSRDEHLAKMGYEVLRFTNEEIVKNCDAVLSAILNRAEEILNGNHLPRTLRERHD